MSNLNLPHFPTKQAVAPFIKWAGGKSSLLGQFMPLFPQPASYRRYFEPFLGGGAVFFFLQPNESYLFDLNAKLIEVYQVVQGQVEALILALRRHYNDREYYYSVRRQTPEALTPVERAARFIFLNKTCFNGLYRENARGQFNVPFGRYENPNICDEEGLRAASAALQKAYLAVADFEVILEQAKAGDFIYLDPPYEPLTRTSSFTSYTSNGFTSADQKRLADVFSELDRKGCQLMLSNSSAPLIYNLYRSYQIHEIKARRVINSKADGRGAIIELLITNY